MSNQFILRCRQKIILPQQIDEISEISGVEILDRSPKMLLVEGEEIRLYDFVDSHKGWVLIPVMEYRLPDQQKKIKKDSRISPMDKKSVDTSSKQRIVLSKNFTGPPL